MIYQQQYGGHWKFKVVKSMESHSSINSNHHHFPLFINFNLAYSVHALIMTWHLNCMYCKDTYKLAMNILKITDFGQKLIQMLAKLFCQNHATFHSLISISICVVSILPNIYFINCEIFLLLRSKKLRWGNRQTEERPETKSIKTSWAWRLVYYQQLSLQTSSLTQASSLQAIKI